LRAKWRKGFFHRRLPAFALPCRPLSRPKTPGAPSSRTLRWVGYGVRQPLWHSALPAPALALMAGPAHVASRAALPIAEGGPKPEGRSTYPLPLLLFLRFQPKSHVKPKSNPLHRTTSAWRIRFLSSI
jgi:hypothetical protein